MKPLLYRSCDFSHAGGSRDGLRICLPRSGQESPRLFCFLHSEKHCMTGLCPLLLALQHITFSTMGIFFAPAWCSSDAWSATVKTHFGPFCGQVHPHAARRFETQDKCEEVCHICKRCLLEWQLPKDFQVASLSLYICACKFVCECTWKGLTDKLTCTDIHPDQPWVCNHDTVTGWCAWLIQSLCWVSTLKPALQKLQKDTTDALFLASQHEVRVVDKGDAP